MIKKNKNNEGLFRDIENSVNTTIESPRENNNIALLYFNEDGEERLYTVCDILMEDKSNGSHDDVIFAAQVLSAVQKYYNGNHLSISLDDMKQIVGKYAADRNFNESSVEFAIETINGYTQTLKDKNRIVVIPIDMYVNMINK